MKTALLVALGACTAACTANQAVPPPSTSSPAPLPLARLASPDASLSKTVGITLAPGGVPIITLRTPPSWTHEFATGEDTRRHVVAGDGARVMLEFWTNEPTWACRDPSCGLATVDVNGARSLLLRPGGGRSFSVFIPRRDDVLRTGIRVVATCATVEACQIAERVVATIRTS